MNRLKKVFMIMVVMLSVFHTYPRQIDLASATPDQREQNFPFKYKKDKNSRAKEKHMCALIKYIEINQSSKATLSPKTIAYNADKLAAHYNIDVDYIIAIMRQESRYYQGAVGPRFKVCGKYRRAYGICQIVYEGAYDTARWHGGPQYSWDDVRTYSYANMDVACYYLIYTWKYHNGVTTEEELICAYNAGPYNVSKYVNKENYTYVRNVEKYVKEIKNMY